jgi:hypothetical protein
VFDGFFKVWSSLRTSFCWQSLRIRLDWRLLSVSGTGSSHEPADYSSHPHNHLRSTLILSSHIQLCLQSFWLISGIQTKILYSYIYRLSYACFIPRPSVPPWYDHPNNSICRRVQIMKLLIIRFSPILYYFITHRNKYSFLYFILAAHSTCALKSVIQASKECHTASGYKVILFLAVRALCPEFFGSHHYYRCTDVP